MAVKGFPQLWPLIVLLVIRPFSFLLVLFAYALILAVVFAMFRHIVPYTAPPDTQPWLYYSLQLVTLFFLVNIIFNYSACTFTDPGSPPSDCGADAVSLLGEETIMVGGQPRRRYTYRHDVLPGASYRYCRKCRLVKPPRCHHCSVSDRCVLNYDHYCPWMFACVGYYNYRYFFLFLAYIFVGCLLVVCLTLQPFLTINGLYRFRYAGPVEAYDAREAVAFTHAFAISLSAMLGVGVLLCWHTYLLLTNQTTLEFHINSEQRQIARHSRTTYRNPFDCGVAKNTQRVFGWSSQNIVSNNSSGSKGCSSKPLQWALSMLPSVEDPPPPLFPFSYLEFREALLLGGGGNCNDGSSTHSASGAHKV